MLPRADSSGTYTDDRRTGTCGHPCGGRLIGRSAAGTSVLSILVYLLNMRHAQSPLLFCAVSVRPKVAALSQSMAASEG